jgi:hypothetical protein
MVQCTRLLLSEQVIAFVRCSKAQATTGLPELILDMLTPKRDPGKASTN